MAEHSTIEWTDATWNPVTGCSIVSPGCTNCYAMKLAGTRLAHHPSRAGLTTDSKAGPVWNGEVRLNEEWLDQPLRWKKPRMIFVCAHGDLFHESVPDEWIDRVFAVMALSPQHTFQVLTKRAKRMREYLTTPLREHRVAASTVVSDFPEHPVGRWPHMPLPNVWLGVSAEDQERADERIPDLLATPAATRFVSAEPLLGSIDFTMIPTGGSIGDAEICANALTVPDFQEGENLDWVIVGGESGLNARPMHPDWARSIRDQCAASGVPFFFKQWGAWSAVSQMTEEQIEACYPPRSERHPEATRKSLVDVCVLTADGTRHGIVDKGAFQQGSGSMLMFEVGKKRAGRMLDGVDHNGMPETHEVPAL